MSVLESTIPKIFRSEDDHGDVVKVELRNRPGVFVTLDGTDYDRLTAAGIRPSLTLYEPKAGFYYVRVSSRDTKGGKDYLARRVADIGPGQRVRYRNGDSLDLRRRNLIVSGTRTKPRRVVLGGAAGQDMRPDGGMGFPEATSGYAYASL